MMASTATWSRDSPPMVSKVCVAHKRFPGKVSDLPPEIQEVDVKTWGIDYPSAGVIGEVDTS